jgi:hypothetical protein
MLLACFSWFWSSDNHEAPITMVQIDVKSPESAEAKLVYNMVNVG